MTIEDRLIEQARAMRRGQRYVGVLFLVGANAAWLIPDEPWAGKAFWFGCATAVGVFSLIVALRDPRKLPFLRALAERRDAITWVYAARGTNRLKLYLGLDDGSRLWMPVSADDGEALFEELVRALPRATAGFEPEREAAFERDPASLRKGG